MEYYLEIYRPGSSNSDACLKTFVAASPFSPIHVGDLISTKTWEVEWPLLRVINIEHTVSELTQGIDPSGRITHRMMIYTESVPDTAATRCHSS
jgi:hypothetical protein